MSIKVNLTASTYVCMYVYACIYVRKFSNNWFRLLQQKQDIVSLNLPPIKPVGLVKSVEMRWDVE